MKHLEAGEVKSVEVLAKTSGYTYEVRGTLKGYEENETFFARLPLSEEVMKKVVDASEDQSFELVAEEDPGSSSLQIGRAHV